MEGMSLCFDNGGFEKVKKMALYKTDHRVIAQGRRSSQTYIGEEALIIRSHIDVGDAAKVRKLHWTKIQKCLQSLCRSDIEGCL